MAGALSRDPEGVVDMTERKARAKSASKVGKGSCPQRKQKTTILRPLWKHRSRITSQWSTKKRTNPGRPRGVPDGYRREEIGPIRAAAKE